MKVTREQAAETRRRIIDVAGRLFRQRGFDGVGVADIMHEAGLTHGGFYHHLASKVDLAAEACAAALAANVAAFAPKDGDSGPQSLAKVTNGYLSAKHRNDIGNGCALAALGSDAGRSSLPVRHAFAEGLRKYVDALVERIPGRSKADKRQKAIATMSGLVGALVLARAVDDPKFSDEILRATSTALQRT